jgi:polysaccharide pyruvyl transferase WcaK-like protein
MILRHLMDEGGRMLRRQFLATSFATALAAALAPARAAGRSPKILLRGSWQTVNIGDIGHTPGILHILEQHIPEALVTLWPSSVDNGVAELLMARFPKLTILNTKDHAQIVDAMKAADFMLHGSSSGFGGQKDLARFAKETGKPYGVYGISLFSDAPETISILNNAKFVYFRDGVSLQYAKDHGVKCPIMEYGPDAAFGVDLRNESAAEAFLKASGLEPGKFLCCIPRLRYTPYWKIKKGDAFDEKKHARNEEMKEHDHAPLRDAVIAVVKNTEMKVLLCPEDMSQMAVGKELIYDKLPADVKPRVVWREKYWLTDEALSVYVRSAGLFGNEMHSPIMCIGNGVPAIVCRFAEQTTKGFMWRDIGLNDWLFDLDDEEQLKRVVPTVLAMAKDPAGSRAKAAKARAFVEQRQRETMAVLRKSLV